MTIVLGNEPTEVLVDSGTTTSYFSWAYYQQHACRLEPLTSLPM